MSRNKVAAQRYAAVGWPVFPVREGGKTPALPDAHRGGPADVRCTGECGRDGHGFYDATTDPAKIDEWWSARPGANVGIATGAPGPDVLDIDVRRDGSGFADFNKAKQAGLVDGYGAVIRTPSGGMHLYYEGTGQHNGSIRGKHVDFRSEGGYVVAPPSRTGQGSYEILKHQPGARTLDWSAVRSLLDPQPEPRPGRDYAADFSSDGRANVERLAAWVSRQQKGDRNFPLFLAAKYAAQRGQLDGPAVERLVQAARESGLRGGEREARRTIESGRRHGLAAGTPEPSTYPGPGGGRPFARQPEPGTDRQPQKEAG